MNLCEHIPLSTLTTFKVGGLARYVAVCESETDVEEAVAFAKENGLPFRVVGEGSNILASDDGFAGVLLQMRIQGLTYEEDKEGTTVTAGAGVPWDEFVDDVVARGLWGIENLAGIPGTVGAAPVQNIGAYGGEIRSVFLRARVLDAQTGAINVYTLDDCAFTYRDSVFKHNRSLVILSVTFSLSHKGSPRLGYGDLAEQVRLGFSMNTPQEIAVRVRAVRATKFPDLRTHGTAGSFFKNPILTPLQFSELSARYGAIPSYPADPGIKIPLAFILDKLLGLNGYREGHVSHFGTQPLVIVAESGATQKEIDAFACAIEKKVFDTFNIKIEREVQVL